jgi:hypothetical protein
MGKPPFKFRPKPAAAATAKSAEPPKLDFIGMDQLLAVYADAFLVTAAGGVYTLYFFQNQLPGKFTGTIMETGQVQTKESKAVARIVITPDALVSFVKALAAHAGLRVEGKKDKKEEAEAK